MIFAMVSIFVATATVGAQQYFIDAINSTTQLNDATVGTGLNQFEFSGSWLTDAPTGAFHTDNHYSNATGNYYRVRFSGIQAKIYSEKSKALGIYGVSIDGGAETMVDPYAATRSEQQLIYTSPVLANGSHNIKVRITGNKNASASGTYMSADRVDVIAPVTATPTPTPVPTRTPTPTPTAAPTKAPVTTTAKTPTPAAPRPAGSASTSTSVKPADITPPTAPGDLQAMVTGNNAVVILSWKASTASTGVLGYHVERSSDGGQNWSVLTSATSELGYTDDAAAFAIHYTYRVSALGQTGLVSEYSKVDASTGNFTATIHTTKAEVFKSDDGAAAAEVPAGALSTDANCSIVTQDVKLGTTERKVAAGAYILICKDSTGKVLSEFSQPVRWSVDLNGRLSGLKNPEAAAVNSSGAAASIPGASYDPKTQMLHFNQSSSSQVAVLAEARHGLGAGWIVLIILMLLGAATFVVLLRTHQIERYRDYLMQKYYNL